MSNISVDYDVLNQRGSPAWFTDTFANIPTAGYVGRMFISKDTFAFYRDTGTGWDLIGGPGIGTLTGSGVAGQVSFFNGTQVLAGNNNLFWDNTNSRLGINTTTPGQALDIHSTGNTLVQLNNTTTANSNISFQNQNVAKWRIGNVYNAGANSFDIQNAVLSNTPISIDSASSITTFSTTTNMSALLQTQVGIYLNQGVQANAIAPYTAISGYPNGLFICPNSGTGYYLTFPASSSYVYTFPASTGTIALTSNLSSYVPYTGATTTVNIGTNSFLSKEISIEGNGTDGGGINIKQYASSIVAGAGYTALFATTGTLGILFGAGNSAIISGASLSANRTFTLPNASGTFALTSDITSAINGTTNTLAKFTSANVIGNSGVSDDGTNLTYTSTAKATLLVKAANNTFYGQLAFTNGSNASYGGISYNNSGQYMQFETSTSEWMRLGSSGNLLLNTTTDAGYRLDINGTIRGTGSIFGDVGFRTNSLNGYLLKNDANSGNLGGLVRRSFWAGGAALDTQIFAESGYGIYLNVNGSTTTGINILSSGYIGLGVIPTTDVDIANTTRFRSSVYIADGTAAAPSLRFFNANIGMYLVSGSDSIGFSTGNTARMFINANGVIAISDLAGTGSRAVLADASGNLSAPVSDISVKQNIKPIGYGLNEILKMNPIWFDFIDEYKNYGENRQNGNLAQEMKEIIPEAVFVTPSTNKMGINYEQLHAVYIKAIQELNEKLLRNNIN